MLSNRLISTLFVAAMAISSGSVMAADAAKASSQSSSGGATLSKQQMKDIRKQCDKTNKSDKAAYNMCVSKMENEKSTKPH